MASSTQYIADRTASTSPLPFDDQYFTAASSIVSPSPSPAPAADDSPDIDVDMKSGRTSSQGVLKNARMQAYARQPKRTSAHPPTLAPPSGAARRPGMSPGLAATIAKLRHSPPAAVMVELNKQKAARQKQMLSREAMLLQEDEYADDIMTYWREREGVTRPDVANMDQQPELRWEMRPCLVDFLIEVHLMHRMRPETLYLAINIIDRYVSKRIVLKKHYQLVGCAALWIAAKFEDEKSRIPTLPDLTEMCRNAYDPIAFVQMEKHLLATVGWDIGHPTAEGWMRLKCSGEAWEPTRTQHVARFLMELTLFKKEFCMHLPSHVSHGALCLAKYILGESRYTRNEDTSETREISEMLDEVCAKGPGGLSETVMKKYQPQYYSQASRLVADWYAKGRRYHYSPFDNWHIELPASPNAFKPFYGPTLTRAGSSIDSLSDLSSSSSSSESGDSMPATPITPINPYSNDVDMCAPTVASAVTVVAAGKENRQMLFGVTSDMVVDSRDDPIAKHSIVVGGGAQVYGKHDSFVVPQLSIEGVHGVQYDFSVA